MKLIKKIAAIMFAFMMVVSMSCNVKAEETEGVYGQHHGSITITDALPDQTYTIYEMLKLESFSGDNYSYTIADGWEDFFKEGAVGATYMQKDENGYMSFKENMGKEDKLREFAQKALAYATNATGITKQSKSTQENKNTVEFDGLNLGYYLVDSTTGALCGLDTTHKTVEIAEKNGVPSVDKTITNGGVVAADGKSNSANIGDVVKFKTTITAQAGAEKYVLHDTMDNSLTFNNDVAVTYNETTLSNSTDYTVTKPGADGCTFDVTFKDGFLNTLTANAKIYVKYSATVNDKAVVKTPMTNETYLTYGDKNTVTNKPKTTTKTFGIPVFKYTGKDTPLKDAQFILSTDSTCNDDTKNLKFSLNESGKYRFNTLGTATLKSQSNGYIYIEGLKAGTYYLKETKAPDGYNLLKTIQTIEIGEDGSIKLNGTAITDDVRVKNNSGTLLPHTGGAGTTMIYLVGALLVLGSGVVLASKRRSNSK